VLASGLRECASRAAPEKHHHQAPMQNRRKVQPPSHGCARTPSVVAATGRTASYCTRSSCD